MTTRTARSPRKLIAAVTLAAAAASLLSGCATAVSLDPGAAANDADCAYITVALPQTVAGLPKRDTDAQATGAWGSPASILLRCGVEVPGPTTLECTNVNGVDWIIDDTDAPNYTFTTYGRDPAVQVVVDSDVTLGSTALVDLEPAISNAPDAPFTACVGVDEVEIPDTTE
ncbi:DUF3515 domain-containing protein [Labedella endophytica]|jgi:hypothetical protein|uniref:DUF3515 domain-containing protein n=1 Tax=Labedella endophytica TaxID=1523160 RepID=A0A3S0VRH5_9MICO|nr:DUF3515 domain-containing protein [Labedella endophytica]RUQ98013.1 DUF3515 domain-containing protein [Labedella endophytica]